MSIATDARQSARALFSQPGLAIIAVLALTLGIGLTTMMFSIIQGALLRGLPFDNADRIAAIGSFDTARGDSQAQNVAQADFAAWAESQRSFDVLGAYYEGTINISDGSGEPERFDGAFITATALNMVGIAPMMGRSLQAADEALGAPRVVVIGHSLWQRRYGGDSTILSRAIRVNGQPASIVGVMPEGFRFPSAGQVWVPLTIDPSRETLTTTTSVTPVGLLAQGVTMDAAKAEFAGLAARLAAAYPETNRTMTATVMPFVSRFLGPEVLSLLLTMLGAVFGVLLIACANVANLLIARTAVRTKEIAIRTALGASRGRVMRQLLTESAVLAAAGTLGGLGLAYAGIGLFNRAIVDTQPPFWIDIRLDPTVLAFTATLAVVATIAAGLLPALQASRADVNEVLKDESRGSSGLRVGRLSRALVIGEIAVSCGLLVASGLAIKSIVNLRTADFGFATDSVFTARLALFESDYPTADDRARFYADLDARLNALPGVARATVAMSLPATGTNRARIVIDGATYATKDDHPPVSSTAITPGFFETFDRQLLRGRSFRESDAGEAPRVAIVNETFAEKFLAGGDPIGRRFRLSSAAPDAWITVIGVAPNLYMGDLQAQRLEGFYTPMAQDPSRFASLAVRTAGPPMDITAAVRAEVAAVDADLPLYWVRTMAEFVAQNTWHYRVFGSLFAAFGLAALFLSTVGLYGVTSFSVSRRTQEIGVRLALGASSGQVRGMVLRQGLWQLAIGLATGLVLAAGLAQLLTVLMFGVQPFDTGVFSLVIVALFGATILACIVPAQRALRVSPTTALRG